METLILIPLWISNWDIISLTFLLLFWRSSTKQWVDTRSIYYDNSTLKLFSSIQDRNNHTPYIFDRIENCCDPLLLFLSSFYTTIKIFIGMRYSPIFMEKIFLFYQCFQNPLQSDPLVNSFYLSSCLLLTIASL